VSIFSELLLAFVCRNFPQLAFSSAGHYGLLGLLAKKIKLLCEDIITQNAKEGQAPNLPHLFDNHIKFQVTEILPKVFAALNNYVVILGGYPVYDHLFFFGCVPVHFS